MNATKQIDWNAVADLARGMSIAQINYAIADILETLPNADAFDRSDHGNRGGYYRDELSVYRKELKTRLDK